MIFTSYYKNMERVGFDYVLIQVSNSKPSWFPYETYALREVYPDWKAVEDLKAGRIDEYMFTKLYKEKLATLNKTRILSILNELSESNEDKDVVLLCWEGKNKFCHRSILAEWLGKDVEEL